MVPQSNRQDLLGTNLDNFLSPSLSTATNVGIPAYELKCLLTHQQASQVHQRAAGQLVADSHADPTRDLSYLTTSLYCDTAQFDVFHRIGSFKRRKHRLRRYGDAAAIFLERKSKWGDRVKKRRSMVSYADLALLTDPPTELPWPGDWFHQHVQRRQLLPVCRISYERVALNGLCGEKPVRLTFDRNIRGALTNDWSVSTVNEGTPLFADQVICEFKYQAFLPALFKEIIQDMGLTPTPVSKYRTFLRTLGIVGDRRAIDA